MIVKASPESEAGLQVAEEFAARAAFNAEMVKAGITLDGAGLKPTRNGVRILLDAGTEHGTGRRRDRDSPLLRS